MVRTQHKNTCILDYFKQGYTIWSEAKVGIMLFSDDCGRNISGHSLTKAALVGSGNS